MKRITKGLCVVMAAVLLVSVFAGCKKKDDADTENFNYSAALGDDGFWKGVKASKLVTLPENYLSIEIPANVHTITDEAVGVEVGKLMDTFAKAEQLKNRAVADGDTLNIDYVGSIGGKEFEGGSTGGGGTSVTVGTTQYIDDFINQLIGHKPGDTFNIEVTFPDNYGKEELNGKDAVFVTTINYIEGKKITPELTDAFVAENLAAKYGFTTIDEMKSGLAKSLQATAINDYIYKFLLDNSKVSECPKSMIEFQEKSAIDFYKTTAKSYGMELDEFISATTGISGGVDAILEKLADGLKETATYSLIMQAIAEKEGIKIADEDLAKYFTKNFGSADYSKFEETYGLPYLKWNVILEKISTQITDNAKKA